MSYSFEYIDIILLAMIAGFIFLRLRGILGKRTGFEGKAPKQFDRILKEASIKQAPKIKETFDENDQKEFLKGAKIAYETIITDFSDNDNKITTSKPLLNNEIYNQFNEALKERNARGHYAEITFIGINSAIIKDHKKLRLTTFLNSKLVQDTTADKMIFSIEEQIAYASTLFTLFPGDLIATGSPDGTGGSQVPKRHLVSGDTLKITVSGLTTLVNNVV